MLVADLEVFRRHKDPQKSKSNCRLTLLYKQTKKENCTQMLNTGMITFLVSWLRQKKKQ